MSDSPKYSKPQLDAEREARLRRQQEERDRAAREAERRRREELEAKEAQRKLNATRSAASSMKDRISEEMAAFAKEDAARHLDPLQSSRLQMDLQEVGASLAQCSQSSADRAVKQLEVLRQAGEDLRKHARNRLEAEHAAAEQAALDRIAAEVEECVRTLESGSVDSTRFDPAGWEHANRLVRVVRVSVTARSVEASKKGLEAARLAIATHTEVVHTQRDAWERRRQLTARDLELLKGDVEALRQDADLSRWIQTKLNELADRVAGGEQLLQTSDFSALEELTARAKRDLNLVWEEARATQALEARRGVIVDAMLEVLRSKGFEVVPGTPALEHAGSPRSAVVIVANRLGGGRMGVSVPQEGDIWYDVQGFPMQQTGTEQHVIRECDEAEDAIEALHEGLLRCGVIMSKVMWNGKPPERRRKDGRERRNPDHHTTGG